MLIWNVRGLNTKQKQHLVIDAIRQERVDVAMLTETRLTRPFWMDGMHVCQTMYQKKGGCLTASSMSSHRRVKQLGTYLSWSKISTTEGEVQLLTCYIEPGDNKTTRERADTVVAVVQDMIRQDRNARILVGGDINGQLENLHSQLVKVGFRAGLE